MKTPNVSEIYTFFNREARECESARARDRECDSEVVNSLPRILAISSLAFF